MKSLSVLAQAKYLGSSMPKSNEERAWLRSMEQKLKGQNPNKN